MLNVSISAFFPFFCSNYFVASPTFVKAACENWEFSLCIRAAPEFTDHRFFPVKSLKLLLSELTAPEFTDHRFITVKALQLLLSELIANESTFCLFSQFFKVSWHSIPPHRRYNKQSPCRRIL